MEIWIWFPNPHFCIFLKNSKTGVSPHLVPPIFFTAPPHLPQLGDSGGRSPPESLDKQYGALFEERNATNHIFGRKAPKYGTSPAGAAAPAAPAGAILVTLQRLNVFEKFQNPVITRDKIDIVRLRMAVQVVTRPHYALYFNFHFISQMVKIHQKMAPLRSAHFLM